MKQIRQDSKSLPLSQVPNLGSHRCRCSLCYCTDLASACSPPLQETVAANEEMLLYGRNGSEARLVTDPSSRKVGCVG